MHWIDPGRAMVEDGRLTVDQPTGELVKPAVAVVLVVYVGNPGQFSWRDERVGLLGRLLGFGHKTKLLCDAPLKQGRSHSRQN